MNGSSQPPFTLRPPEVSRRLSACPRSHVRGWALYLGLSQEKDERHDPNDRLPKDINRIPWRWKQEQPARSQHEKQCHTQQYAGNDIPGIIGGSTLGNPEQSHHWQKDQSIVVPAMVSPKPGHIGRDTH